MAPHTSSRCDACRGDMGPGQAALTSECDHTFHVRCVNGRAACPVCHARWSETPAVASAAAPANPFFFASPPAPSQPSATADLFGHVPPPPATGNSFAFSSSPAFQTSVFGSSSPQTSSSSFSFNFPGATYPSSSQSFGGIPFGPQPPFCSVCSSFICRGQAAVKSECNHTFHLRCISGGTCPVCRAVWRDVVSMQLTPSPPFNAFSRPQQWSPFERHASSSSFGPFNDDEPVEIPVDNAVQEPGHDGVLVLKTHCEHPAVARDAAQENFVVMVNAKAPLAVAGAAARAPLDIVTVLDVSGSMSGYKLQLLKQAMGFVIDNLSSADRLSIVTFSTNARRVTWLTRMSDAGKALAKGAVESLSVECSTNIGDGLRVAAEVLAGRRHKNAVASIILLSDGQDNCSGCFGDHVKLVPHSLRRGTGNRGSPVHTFGFGTDHDTAAMHAIAEATGGTFSFIQNEAVVQDSFAQCIGGLLSVAVLEARLAVECLHPGVRIRAVKSGVYETSVGDDGRVASVYFGMMYAEEERRILLFLSVPVAAGDGGVTRLIKVSCNYRNAATRLLVNVASEEEAVVQRPVVVAAADMEPSVEVARERFRVEAAEDIAAARAAAERGEHAEAARILNRRQEASAAAGLAGDARCAALVAELREMSARVASRREYEQTGRACLLAGISSHAQQRASTVQLFGSAVPGVGAPPSYGGGTEVGARAGFGGPSLFGAPAAGVSCPSPFGAPPAGVSCPSPFGALPPIPSCGAPASSFVSGAPAPAPSFGSGFRTRAMEDMVELSRKRREQQGGPFGSN